MGEIAGSHDADVGRLLTTYYEGVEMNDAFRLALQIRTRRLVGGRTRIHARRWVLVAVGAAAVAVAVVMLARLAVPPTIQRPSPAVAERAPTPAPAQVNAAAGSERRQTAATSGSTGPKAAGPTERPAPAGGTVQAGGPLVAVISARAPVSDATGRALEVGDRLAVGAIVRTGKGGRVSLYTRRGSEFTLNADTELVVASWTTAELRRGEVYCRSRGGEIERMDTAAGKIHLLGTVVDAAAQNGDRVAVTVVSGKVRLSNAHGEALVQAGRRSVLVASLPPQGGAAVNTFAATAWYDGRGEVVSDFGDIPYLVSRGGMSVGSSTVVGTYGGPGTMKMMKIRYVHLERSSAHEVWVMSGDGTGKHRIKSFVSFVLAPGPWLPGQQWLLVETRSDMWSAPDLTHHKLKGGAGHEIVSRQKWLINAATGQDLPLQRSAAYQGLYSDLSPDGTRLAFCGRSTPDESRPIAMEDGVWVYDVPTGETRKVLDRAINTAVAWAPDGHRLVVSTGKGYETDFPLAVVDADTGKVTELGVQGAGGRFSPDGTRLVYCGDFQPDQAWYLGVPASGGIFVLDLAPGSTPRRLTPQGETYLQPRWSPDGTRIAYWVGEDRIVKATGLDGKPSDFHDHNWGYTVYVARADGFGITAVYHQEVAGSSSPLYAVSWTPSGDALYLSTDQRVLLVDADGSGVIRDLGGNAKDSVLSPAQQADTDGAVAALQEASFQYSVGNVRAFEGRLADSRKAFRTAADICASLMWRFPLADYNITDVLRYADASTEMAGRSDQAILAASCKERMAFLERAWLLYRAREDKSPADIATLRDWVVAHPREAGIEIEYIGDTDWAKMIFQCPLGASFVYTPRPTDPKRGEVVVTCPGHPDCRVVLFGGWLRPSDPAYEAMVDQAKKLAHEATFGLVPWPQVEQAYRAVLKRSPDDPEMRETLGRMYTRWGRYREALETLPQNSEVLGGWAGLNQAFCLDALGKRAEAVAIYAKLAELPADSAIGAWARLGLKGPIWPRDLDLNADPAEVRLMPTAAWRASASDSADLAKPEYAIDGNLYSRWCFGGGGQEPGQWFRLDFDTPQSVRRIVLDHQGRGTFYTNDWPRGLRAEVTADGTTWDEVSVVQGGLLQPAMVRFATPRSIRGIRFTLTAGHSPEWWSIYELYVFGPAR